MKSLIIAVISAFLLFGCSGKEQTNPLPDQKKFHLPNSNSNFNNAVLKTQSEEYENYTRNFFGKDRIVKAEPVKVRTQKELEQRSIWQIGREKGYFDEKKK
nr:hypothetical protein [Campylobacter sp.]